ncbi:MAG: LTA synthase family protein [Defluviitaleaceae bacterium]|nr:LTA synthase family protein [Defluviitaleaceae bacterium]
MENIKFRESYVFDNPVFLFIMRLYALIFPFILFFALESLNPASLAFNMGSYLVSVFLIMLAVVMVYSIVGSVVWAYGMVSAIWLTIYIVNHFRIMITGGVFVPTDIFVAGAAAQMFDFNALTIERMFLLRVFIVLVIHLPLIFAKIKIKSLKRLVILPVAGVIFVVFFTGHFAAAHVLPALGLNEGTISGRYRTHGVMLGFYSVWVEHTTRTNAVDEELIYEFFTTGSREVNTPDVTPNVIVIMSEAFMNPATLPNLTFSREPIPNFNRLAAQAGTISGNVVVPVYGGGTANTEFEFIGGSPHVFFGSRFYIPFENREQYFNREILTALPWMFRANGYRTVGVHPYYEAFFNRHMIYPMLGFDEFITVEDMPNAPIHGEFISDEYFTDRIIEQIILAETDDVPLFLFGISMQNHWGFDPMKYGTLDLDVMAASPYLNDEEIGSVNAFLQGISDADKQLGRLVEFVESRDTPTMIVFFGDHLPIMGLHADNIFETIGFVSHQADFNWTLEDQMAIFQTPYLVWANYDLGQEDWGTLSAFALGARVAEVSGVQLNRYFTYVLRGLEHFSVITNELYLDVNGVFHQGWTAREEEHILALQSLWIAKIHGHNAFHRSLAALY